MKDEGFGASEIARQLGINRSTVYKILKETR
ncbi:MULTISPECIES: helix-turn-helix domain-containing protein [Photorhabdus]|nr:MULTISPECIES: helix-turn-helix domain-containing protein [Photorhabdus]